MASRTKSFFEQDHKSKQRPGTSQWHRNNRQPLAEGNPNIPPAKPPIPATSQSKTKLKAFQFIPGQPEEASQASGDKGKENASEEQSDVQQADAVIGMVDKSSSAPQRRAEPGTSSQTVTDDSKQTPQLPHANTFPCTPGARLSLEDLVGNFDENAKRGEVKEQSPEEQIGWIPNSSSTLLTPNRKRKRAKSSSPSCPGTSSQRQEASAFFLGNGTQGEKKTPEADPTAALWQKYGGGKESVDGFKVPDLSHVMFQASPRPLETPVKGAGFRRWASTGNDWPSSKNKRRRTDSRPSISLWQDEQQQQQGDSAGRSRVAEMVEKIQETLATQKLAQSEAKPADALSSSSPLPETGADSFSAPNPSPLQAHRQPPAPRRASNTIRAQPAPAMTARPQTVSSDDPDPPFKAATAPQSAPDVVKPAPLHLHSKAPLPAYKRPSISRTISSGSGRQYPVKQPSPPQPAPPPPPAVTVDIDEFGDDFDLTAEDLDELASQVPLNQRSLYDIPQHPNPPQQQPTVVNQSGPAAAASRAVIVLEDDDDEFGGDDLDVDALAQAEISATQAYRASQSTSSHNAMAILPSPHRKRSPKKSRSPRKGGSPTKCSQQLTSVDDGVSKLQRYRVKQIVEGEYTNPKGRRCPEKVLMAEDERTKNVTAITLRDSWTATTATAVAAGNVIHIASLPTATKQTPAPHFHSLESPPGQITISDSDTSPLLIIHPDHMLSATTVADSFDCIRKAVLQDRIKATGEASKAMVYGKILHEIFQQALSANRWDQAFLDELVEITVRNHVEGLWELGMQDYVMAVEEVRGKMGELAAWAAVFVAETPGAKAVVDDRQGEKVWMSVSKLIAIEEHIWSPRYGLKGNIDATIQSTLIDDPRARDGKKKLIAPFEVKTGRTTQSAAHRAQTALYTLLLSDRYDVEVKAGILYYLESSTMSRIAPPVNEVRQMVQQRNRLASYIHGAKHPRKESEEKEAGLGMSVGVLRQTQEIEESGLPTMLKNPFKCGRCYAQQSCFTYHGLVEKGSAESAGMVDDGKKNHSLTWQEAVGHLQLSAKNGEEAEKLKTWFAKWDKLLTFEESEMSRYRKELWTMESVEREAVGRCFGNLVLEQDLTSTAKAATQSVLVDGIEGSGGKINRFTYLFKRATLKAGSSFAEGTQLTIGEPVVVSSESGQWALANGYVVASSKHDITVAVDRKLGDARQRLKGFEEGRNHAFRGAMSVGTRSNNDAPNDEQMLYRLDKDEFSNGLALVRNNLVSLMGSHPIHTKLRKQVICSTAPTLTTPSQLPILPPSQLGEMNEDQRAAVSKVLSAQDYALILGMPGTGKTTTIAHIIRALLADNKTILLTSFTHTAVDNILLKIRDVAPPNSILRLGVSAKINSEVQKFCHLAATPRKSIEEIESVYMGCRIVATTCMGTNHAVFNRRSFDIGIVDEASQITLPTALGPLLHARTFVLVGDHNQLPPLVQNRAALEGGLDVSLFRQLNEEHPEAVATLGKQYRMCEEIMSLSNSLIYGGKLRCGNEAVAQRTLVVEDMSRLQEFHSRSSVLPACRSQCWLEHLTDPDNKVVFANTDALGKGAMESLSSGKNITNQLEATLAAQLVLALLRLGIPGSEIGIITLYRSQLALIRQLFRRAGVPSSVEIDSADRFQGRDKECVILSMVRSNDHGIVGELLKDWRRVNVALTRARSKLVVLGSRRTLVNNELLAEFFDLVEGKKWAMDLPTGADACHTFDSSTQSTAGLLPTSTPSPAKRKGSPRKVVVGGGPLKVLSPSPSPSKVLMPSASAGNRSSAKRGGQAKGQKVPGKVIKGSSKAGKMRASQVKGQVAMEIFEDLTADDF